MEWLVQNWPYVGCGILGLVIVATVIVAITKSKSDDTVMGKVLNFLGKYVSIIMTVRQKELLEIAKKILNGEMTVEEAKKEIKAE